MMILMATVAYVRVGICAVISRSRISDRLAFSLTPASNSQMHLHGFPA